MFLISVPNDSNEQSGVRTTVFKLLDWRSYCKDASPQEWVMENPG